MIENTRISLRPNDLPRQTAKGIIQYTLLLDYKSLDDTPIDNDHISRIAAATDSCCSQLISITDPATYIFFGENTEYSPKNLLYLNRFPPTLEVPNLPRDVSFSKLLVQNSLMNAYHAILTEYLGNCATTSYQIVNRLKGAGPHKAMSTNKNGQSCVAINGNNVECVNLPKHSLNSDKNSSNASTFGKKFSTRLKKFPTLFAFTVPQPDIDPTITSFSYNLQFAALTKRIVDATESHLNCILNCSAKNITSEKMADSLSQLIKHFTPALYNGASKTANMFEDQNNDIVDGVYEYYLSEKAFSLNLFYSTIKILQDAEAQHNNRYNFKHPENLMVIAKCKELSSPFISPYLLQFAFDHINVNTTSYQDYWDTHALDKRDVYVSRSKKPGGFHYDQWLRQFELFVDYLSAYIIPVYDWCFLSMLLEGIEKEYPEYSHLQCLEKALALLGNYIQTNAKNLLFPLQVANPQNMAYDFFPTGFSTEWINELHKLFFDKRSVNLNITPLTREMFTCKKDVNGNIKAGENLRAIRDLYIESIVNPY